MGYKEYLLKDGITEPSFFSKSYFMDWLLKSEQYYIQRYIRLLRIEEYYTFVSPNKLMKYYYRRKRNILGVKLGFFIHPGNFDFGLKIYHYGSIIVHPKAKIGTNCTLHGNCCIGSKGGYPDIPPVLGDNIDIGQGAQIIGGISIADNVKVGAGAVVVKSVSNEGGILVGVPAKVINSRAN